MKILDDSESQLFLHRESNISQNYVFNTFCETAFRRLLLLIQQLNFLLFVVNERTINITMKVKLKQSTSMKKKLVLPYLKSVQQKRYTPRGKQNNKSLPNYKSSYLKLRFLEINLNTVKLKYLSTKIQADNENHCYPSTELKPSVYRIRKKISWFH